MPTRSSSPKSEAQGHPIPVIDLFAGPGGLSEGFSSLLTGSGRRRFDVRVSIEKDPKAQRTLELRALFRAFPPGRVPDCYYDYIQGRINRAELFGHPAVAEAAMHAASEARLAELGRTPAAITDGWIADALKGATRWALIGGPPCQAYSVAGRARMRGKDRAAFEKDKRHFLYTEYLRIIQKFCPDVFVMENVKGLLTSTHGGSPMFDRILADLRNPSPDLSYQIRSLIVPGDDLVASDYLISSENYGIPQCRHRVILFGIRSDIAARTPLLAADPARFLLEPTDDSTKLIEAVSGLPPIRSRLSNKGDSYELWRSVLKGTPQTLKRWKHESRIRIEEEMLSAWRRSEAHRSTGGAFIKTPAGFSGRMPLPLAHWFRDEKLDGVLQHESRSHMSSDLHRYMFAACYAKTHRRTPKLKDFPPKLLPDHENISASKVPFVDRFRVQLQNSPSSTIVSHIAKDGHYYIHPDPAQCRSLTVREAARLQTFPDNYFFEGNRTEQYHQVGNAVPPLLAHRIAAVVSDFIASVDVTAASKLRA